MKNNNRKQTVCVVTDDKDVVEIFNITRKHIDISVATCSDPVSALKTITRKKSDIVIIDMLIAGFPGLAFIREIQKKRPATNIILMTDHISNDIAAAAIKLGATEYLLKPVKASYLELALQRTAEKSALLFGNEELAAGNRKMISGFSMLYNISNILNEVSDFDYAMDMVLDIFADYLDIDQCAIMFAEKGGDIFRVQKHRKLQRDFCNNFAVRENSKINGVPLSGDDITILNNIEQKIEVEKRTLRLPAKIRQCFIVPFNFRNELLGFLAVFLKKNHSYSTFEFAKLLRILSAQITPVMAAFKAHEVDENIFGERFYQAIQKSMHRAEDLKTVTSFAILRLRLNKVPEINFVLFDLMITIRELISGTVEDEFELTWLTFDTALLVLPGADLYWIERTCFEIRKQFDLLEFIQLPELIYSCSSYPEDGLSAIELSGSLWKNFFSEVNKPEALPHKIMGG